jgi:allantoinase
MVIPSIPAAAASSRFANAPRGQNEHGLPGWGQAADFFVSLRDNFDALHREGEQAPKMMTVALHCRLAGKPARAAAFARFVNHILRHDRVWICRRNEIAKHWRRQHPAKG